jgi:phage tail-like protein
MTQDLIEYFMLDVPAIGQAGSLMGMFKSVTGLDASYEVLEYHEGGNNDFVHHLPGRMQYPNLVLSWGLTNNDQLQRWFFQTHAQAQAQEITVKLMVQRSKEGVPTEGNTQRAWTFADAFPVRWSGPQLEVGSGLWGETLEIAHSGMKLA